MDGREQQASRMQYQVNPSPSLHRSPAYPGPAFNMPGRDYGSGHARQPSQLQHQAVTPTQVHPSSDYNMPDGGNRRGYGQELSPPQQQANTPPSSHPSQAYDMPIEGDGHGHCQRGSRPQHQLGRSFSVLVIDDSDSDAQDGIILRPSATQQAMNEPMDWDANYSQAPLQSIESDENEDDNWNIQRTRGNGDAQDVPEDQHQVPHDDARGQTNALLHLPEVNIPEGERLETPRGLNCELLPHQRVGLTWLIRQEQDPNKRGSILAGKETSDLVPYSSLCIFFAN